MPEVENVIRSVQRWAAVTCLCLPDGDQWTVETSAREVLDSKRPLVLVELGGDVEATFVRPTWTSGDRRLQASMLVTAFPTVLEAPRQARAGATTVQSLLRDAVDVGIVTTGPPVVQHGGPLSIPLYEYAGVPLEGPGRAGPASPYNHLTIESAPVRAIADPEDERRWTVALTLRLSWWAAGRSRQSPLQPPVVRQVPVIQPVGPGDGPRV